MPLQIPDPEGVVRSLQAYVRTDVPEVDPRVTTRRGFVGGMVKSLGTALHDWYRTLKRFADYDVHPQTAKGGFLREGWWAALTKLDPNPAAPARGRVVITGTPGVGVVAQQVLTGSGVSYTVDRSATIVTQGVVAASLTRIGALAVFETGGAHHLATGMQMTIAGASDAAYNGLKTITVTAENEFTFAVTGTPATPALGVITATAAWANADITATTTGQATNVDAGASLTIANPSAGVTSTARVTFGGIGGGTEAESEESYRRRILEALGSDFGTFTGDEIEIIAKTVPGVTRVFVRKATIDGANGVVEGQVRVAFLRDGDADPVPSLAEVEAVKAALVANITPAHTAAEDVIVERPKRRDVNFGFTSLTPDTVSMRRAVQARLAQFFAEGVEYGISIPVDDYRCAIKDTFDLEGRVALRAFTLSTPMSEIAVAADEMPFLGTITWPS